jgi:hypothetical protein
MDRHRFLIVLSLILCTLIFTGSIFLSLSTVKAAHFPKLSNQTDEPDSFLSISDDVCLECHGQPGLTLTLENGEILDLYVSPDDYYHSIHGDQGYACVQCHRTVGDHPHPPFVGSSKRDATIQLNNTCQYCHLSQHVLTQDSVHATALRDGNFEAAVCSDCHTGHEVRQINDPITNQPLPESRVWVPETCAQCHNEIYQKYLTSVHGSALVNEENTDVPSCIECHGVHNIEDPTTNAFRLKSPQICAECHTDPEIMDKYGISTDVLDTYVADFHGTTVDLFEKQTPDAETNKPVCYDCHGIHDIKKTDDPEKGLHVRENLLVKCQVCHPDATINFPDAWLSHYIPSKTDAPLIYYVNLFYMIFIPVVLGGMGLLVVLDIGKRVRDKTNKSHTHHADKTDDVMVDGERSSPDDQESVSIDSKMPGLESTLDPDSANDSPQENHHD